MIGAMRRNAQIAALVAALCSLLAAPPAGASSVSLAGAVPGDANARISMKVVKRKGQPKSVRQLWFKRLDHECTDGVDREYSRQFPGRIEIGRLLTGKYNFFAAATPKSPEPLAPGGFFVSGETKRSAQRVTVRRIASTIRFPSSQPSGETSCIGDVENVVAKRAAR